MSSLDTRQKLLNAAIQAFADLGFAGARVDEIAKRAGANKAMIYYHFGTKKKLYQAVLLSLFAGPGNELERIADEEPDPSLRLSALYFSLFAAFARQPALPRIMLREILAGGRHMDASTAGALAHIFGLVRSTIDDGVRAGVFRPVHPLLLHLNAVGTLLLFSASGSFRERIKALAEVGIEMPGPEDLRCYLREVLARTLAAQGGRADRS